MHGSASTTVGSAADHTQSTGGDMVQAYILIQTEVGKSGVVSRTVGELEGVVKSEDVTGPYDVIARVEAPSVDDLGRQVISQIQDVPHITRTPTCTVVHL